jgi:hypothetical protein
LRSGVADTLRIADGFSKSALDGGAAPPENTPPLTYLPGLYTPPGYRGEGSFSDSLSMPRLRLRPHRLQFLSQSSLSKVPGPGPRPLAPAGSGEFAARRVLSRRLHPARRAVRSGPGQPDGVGGCARPRKTTPPGAGGEPPPGSCGQRRRGEKACGRVNAAPQWRGRGAGPDRKPIAAEGAVQSNGNLSRMLRRLVVAGAVRPRGRSTRGRFLIVRRQWGGHDGHMRSLSRCRHMQVGSRWKVLRTMRG